MIFRTGPRWRRAVAFWENTLPPTNPAVWDAATFARLFDVTAMPGEPRLYGLTVRVTVRDLGRSEVLPDMASAFERAAAAAAGETATVTATSLERLLPYVRSALRRDALAFVLAAKVLAR